MKILNSNEAYAALIAGKNILCRAVGELIEFNDLDQFPATIFAKSGYEFCIKIETMEVAGITFTKPLTLDDIQVDQEVFMINSTGSILQGKFTPECDALVRAIKNGFVQRDSINAQSQAKALHALLGVEGVIQLKTIDFKNQSDEQIQSVKKRGVKKANNSTSAAANDASVPVEKKTFESQSEITITEQGPITVVEDSLSDTEGFHEHQEYLDILLNDIAVAQTLVEANAQIKYTKSWTEEQRKPVIQAINKRLLELKSMTDPKPEETPSLMVQIQNAPDLTALDMLEIDVGARHPDIQPKLMGFVKRRRFELENQAEAEDS